MKALFANDGGNLHEAAAAAQSLNKEIALYEVNLHTTEGNANADVRQQVAAGRASGSALAKRILEALSVGARRQCVYELAGYDGWLADRSSFVKLWGIVRDLGATRRLRPTGLAVELLNRAIIGDMVRVTPANTEQNSVHVWAFRSTTGWSAAMVSTSPQAQEVSVRFPASLSLPKRMLQIESADPFSTNEDREAVHIVEAKYKVEGTTLRFTLPAYGLAVALSDGGTND